MDLLVSTGIEGKVHLITGGPGGTFSGSLLWDLKGPTGRIGLGDFNSDLAPDVWVIRSSQSQIDVRIAVKKTSE